MALSLEIKRVLISDNLDKCCKDILEASGIAVDVKTKLTKEELLSEISKYDGLIVRSATKVTSDVIQAAKNLKIIGRAGTGVDNIDIPSASQRGIIVMNTPGGNTLSAAEHTCALISCLSRHIAQAAKSMKEGKWDRKKYMGSELMGKTLAIIGLGRIGKEVATRMQSYGMRTIGFDPLVTSEDAASAGIEWMEIDELWPLADYITVHTPLIPQTRGLLCDKTFALCKKGVCVVNCARGGIIDEAALLRALESGQCGGAGLDVFETEPPTGVSAALVQHEGCIACPHLGASTVEAQKRVAKEIAEQFVDSMCGKSLFGAINAMFLSEALRPEIKPWLNLAEKLAVAATKLVGGKVTAVSLTTNGAALKAAGKALSAAVSAGLLPPDHVNLVNAPILAKDIGVEISSKHEDADLPSYGPALTLQVNGAMSLTGTIIGSSLPVLVHFNGLQFAGAVPLTGNLLFVQAQGRAPATSAILQLMAKCSEINAHVNAVFSASDAATCVHVIGTAQALATDLSKVVSGATVYPQISF